MDLRCPHRKFGETIQACRGLLEVSCPSRWCGKEPETVVIHRFDLATGKLVETRSYREPLKESQK